MCAKTNKMQLRLEIVSLLSKYRGTQFVYQKVLNEDIETLKSIEDKETLGKILYKELLSKDEDYSKKCALLILEALDEDTIFRLTCENLVSKNLPDEKKFFMVSIAKQKGVALDRDEVEQNISSCKTIARKSITKFLKNAVIDPEVQIDFLDFYINISQDEKINLLESILDEDDNKLILNIFTLLLKLGIAKEEFVIIEDYFLNCKDAQNPLALEGLGELLRIIKAKDKKNAKIKLIQKQIKKINFKDKTKPKHEFTCFSEIDNCYISFLDGEGEFSLVFTRKYKDGGFALILTTINSQKGLTSCIGFNKIDEEGIKSILRRIYYAYPPISINPIALKSIYEYYRIKNFQTNTIIPYEAFVWEKMLSDIRTINFDFFEFLNSKLEPVEVTKKRFEDIKKSVFLESWFFSYNQNKFFDKIIDIIEEQNITSIENIEKITMDNILKSFSTNKNYIKSLQENLLLQSYIAKLAKRMISSGVLYNTFLDKNLLVRLILYIYKKSIYQYFLNKKQALLAQDSAILFKISKNKTMTAADIDNLISLIEDKWKLKNES